MKERKETINIVTANIVSIGILAVSATKVALANHAWDEPRENEQKAAEVSGIPLITCCIGEIVTL